MLQSDDGSEGPKKVATLIKVPAKADKVAGGDGTGRLSLLGTHGDSLLTLRQMLRMRMFPTSSGIDLMEPFEETPRAQKSICFFLFFSI